MRTSKYLILLLLVVALFACKKNRLKVDVSDIELELNLHRFEKVMFENAPDEVPDLLLSLYDEHASFIDLYTEEIIKIGPIHNDDFAQYLKTFLTDTVYTQVAAAVLTTFSNLEPIETDLQKGFKHYRYYFPNKLVPDIYTYFSGFNESMVVAENFIGISLDKYLGTDCVFYQYLGIPRFKGANMNPQKIVPDVFYAWAITEFPYRDSIDNLLSNMIYQGKLIYFTEAMSPHLPDSLLIGYRADQIKWSKVHEAQMWTYLVEKRLIYNTERLELRRYIGDSPFTNTFGNDSPGRTGVWLGWQIVRSFMNNNKELTLADLMEMNDAQELLNRSKYYPD